MVHKSVYDVLYKMPTLHKRLPAEREHLARAIVASGQIRLDADTECNFVRMLLPEERVNMTFTAREVSSSDIKRARKEKLLRRLAKLHPLEEANHRMENYWEPMEEALRKRHPVAEKTELMMARALVLCNALPVIQLIHKERTEIFISFGQSVGEVMDVARWQDVGNNSGLQAVGAGENAVYISCGGHPFLTKDEYRHSGDGPPALARFMIIAAQETGHNGDMIRNARGQWIGRHSAIEWHREPDTQAAEARRADIATTEKIWNICRQQGLNRIAEWERHLEFYRKVKVRTPRSIATWLAVKAGWLVFRFLMRKHTLPRLQKSPYPCTLLQQFFADMLANLSPAADVYKRKNPHEEEAIAVIEAVARVPQQVVKWGHHAVGITTPRLYEFYYGTIVKACEAFAKPRS